ncbi:MAG: hypothetical protein PHV30_08930 [Candidatus Margulisbacteria bacterium]|nr:hypothetical protein [Candidatus Margulisiibacteriota bacterium]
MSDSLLIGGASIDLGGSRNSESVKDKSGFEDNLTGSVIPAGYNSNLYVNFDLGNEFSFLGQDSSNVSVSKGASGHLIMTNSLDSLMSLVNSYGADDNTIKIYSADQQNSSKTYASLL